MSLAMHFALEATQVLEDQISAQELTEGIMAIEPEVSEYGQPYVTIMAENGWDGEAVKTAMPDFIEVTHGRKHEYVMVHVVQEKSNEPVNAFIQQPVARFM